jgi:hypothetical protein
MSKIMLSIRFLILPLFLFGCGQRETQDDTKLSALDYKSYGFSDEWKEPIVLANEIRIASYKNYLMYRTITIVDTNMSTADDTKIYLNDNSGTKVYSYYVFRKGNQNGLLFSSIRKTKPIELNNLLKHEGLDFENYTLFTLDMGKPDIVVRNPETKEIEIEKFANKVVGKQEHDSLYRYYSKELASIDFSFNKAFDKQKGSKLWKTSLIYNTKANKDVKDPENPRREAYWKVEQVSLSPGDTDSLMKMFNRYIEEEKKWNLN